MTQETVLQFGGGNFLRAFADLFIDQANKEGQNVGRIVVVQSTTSSRADAINAQQGRYHVLLRGLSQGKVVDETLEVQSLSRALSAQSAWGEILQVARSKDLRYVISNTTEAGVALEEQDDPQAPRSFPARLLAILAARHQQALPGLTILPCELLDKNAQRLQALVLEQARRWKLSADLQLWIAQENLWLDTLVDRIVSGRPAAHRLLESDALLTVAEPYGCWVIQSDPRARLWSHPALELVENVERYALRKVRLLNGAHTALVAKALPLGFTTVRQAVENPEIGRWLKELLQEEILPTLEGRIDGGAEFAARTLERFANPFLEHQLSAIALHHSTKLATRLAPTYQEYQARFGRPPERLKAILESPVAV